MMKSLRISCLALCATLLLFLQGTVVSAQNTLDTKVQRQVEAILGRLETERVSLKYKIVLDSEPPIHLEGSLTLEGNCYLAVGNGLEIYSDGSTRWTVDPAEKEVYIENSDGIREVLQYRDSLTDFSISELRYLDWSEDLSAFVFDTAKLSPDWIVTDLRD